MDNRKLLKNITAVVVVFIFTISIVTFAAAENKILTAEYSNIKIVIDGEALTPKDANGAIVEPFIVDGTTYLPVRAITEALGKDVRWDGDTNTVIISTPESVTAQPAINATTKKGKVKLEDLDYLSQSPSYVGWKLGEFRINTGDYMQDCLYIANATAFVPITRDYLINENYKRIAGNIILGYTARSYDSLFTFHIWGDGKLLYTSEHITAGALPQAFDVDISGVNILKLGFTRDKGYDAFELGLSNVILE